MASIEMNAAQPKAHSGIFAKIASVFVSLTENNARARKLAYLSSLTDEQLASKGIKRAEIAQHVFRDVLYI